LKLKKIKIINTNTKNNYIKINNNYIPMSKKIEKKANRPYIVDRNIIAFAIGYYFPIRMIK